MLSKPRKLSGCKPHCKYGESKGNWPTNTFRRASELVNDFVGENRSATATFFYLAKRLAIVGLAKIQWKAEEFLRGWPSCDPSVCFYVAPGCQDRNPIFIIFYRYIWKDLQPPFFQDLWSHDISWWRLIWRCVGGGTGAERDYLDAFTRGQLKVFKALNGGSMILDRSGYSYFSSGGLLWMRWLASCSWICL